MEGPRELCDRIENDISKLEKMYEVAAKLYPYENVHGPRNLNEQIQRTNNLNFAVNESPEGLLK